MIAPRTYSILLLVYLAGYCIAQVPPQPGVGGPQGPGNFEGPCISPTTTTMTTTTMRATSPVQSMKSTTLSNSQILDNIFSKFPLFLKKRLVNLVRALKNRPSVNQATTAPRLQQAVGSFNRGAQINQVQEAMANQQSNLNNLARANGAPGSLNMNAIPQMNTAARMAADPRLLQLIQQQQQQHQQQQQQQLQQQQLQQQHQHQQPVPQGAGFVPRQFLGNAPSNQQNYALNQALLNSQQNLMRQQNVLNHMSNIQAALQSGRLNQFRVAGQTTAASRPTTAATTPPMQNAQINENLNFFDPFMGIGGLFQDGFTTQPPGQPVVRKKRQNLWGFGLPTLAPMYLNPALCTCLNRLEILTDPEYTPHPTMTCNSPNLMCGCVHGLK